MLRDALTDEVMPLDIRLKRASGSPAATHDDRVQGQALDGRGGQNLNGTIACDRNDRAAQGRAGRVTSYTNTGRGLDRKGWRNHWTSTQYLAAATAIDRSSQMNDKRNNDVKGG